MSRQHPLSSLPLPGGRRLDVDESQDRLHLLLDGQPLLELAAQPGEQPLLKPLQPALPDADALGLASYLWLAREPGCQALRWQLSVAPAEALAEGWLVPAQEAGVFVCERGVFWQRPAPWVQAQPVYPERLVMSEGRRHPRRPPKPSGEVYRRFDARLGAWFSLRILDIEADLERFNRWQNSPRVLAFWQEGGSLDHHRAYLHRLADDPHTLTLVGCFDDEPFAYFEAYWAKEDRIAPFYAVDDYDRGIHMLVGEEHHRGPHKVAAWLAGLTHYLFLDDPRTRRVVAEPRADNARMIGHMQGLGFYREKEFDFPHKRAALMAISRERFFDRCTLA